MLSQISHYFGLPQEKETIKHMAERANLGLQNYYYDGSIPIFTQSRYHNWQRKKSDFDWSDFNQNGDLFSDNEDESQILNQENQMQSN